MVYGTDKESIVSTGKVYDDLLYLYIINTLKEERNFVVKFFSLPIQLVSGW